MHFELLTLKELKEHCIFCEVQKDYFYCLSNCFFKLYLILASNANFDGSPELYLNRHPFMPAWLFIQLVFLSFGFHTTASSQIHWALRFFSLTNPCFAFFSTHFLAFLFLFPSRISTSLTFLSLPKASVLIYLFALPFRLSIALFFAPLIYSFFSAIIVFFFVLEFLTIFFSLFQSKLFSLI